MAITETRNPPSGNPPSEWIARAPQSALSAAEVLLFALGVVALVYITLFAVEYRPNVMDGLYFGSDTFTRMSRVKELFAGGAWYNPVLERVGPDGLILHWTRPMDIAIAVVASALAIFLPLGTALDWAGAIVSPLLHAITVVGVAALLFRRLPEDTLHMLVLVLVMAPPFHGAFELGRPDHQSLQVGLMLIMIALASRLIAERGRNAGLAIAAGVAAGLLTWSTPSGSLPAITAVGAFGLLWCGWREAFARTGAIMATAAAATAAAVLVVERGVCADCLTALEPDRISALHVLLFAGLAVGFEGARWLDDRFGGRAAVRWGYGVAGLACAGVALFALLPQLAGGHVVEIDQLYQTTRGARIQENRLLFEMDFISKAAPIGGLLVVSMIVAGPIFVFRPSARPLVLFLVTMTLAYALFYHERSFGLFAKVMPYMSAPMAFLYAFAVGSLITWVRQASGKYGVIAASATKVGAAVWMALLALVPDDSAAAATGAADRPSADAAASNGSEPATPCHLNPLRDELAALAARHGPDALVMTVPELSTELLYLTDFRVMAIPNHRYQPWYREMYEIFGRADADAALARAAALGVAGFIACPGAYRSYFPVQAAGRTFYDQLLAKDSIAGIDLVSGPEQDIVIYSVTMSLTIDPARNRARP